ncbi:Eco57I restriction-modification methylase domain-containing protein [Corallococcus terminator]|uniref:site-specific DNA-methyltransferase (adenine-specific) n=1 Tax=Corallococcus terminator TaxID=2316733 RepID=A0A3A8IUU3_9BACT|nr:N-6 DNA methylase [Corallococcus terminator]RKG87105.1 restriction endonuclease [Corallococcus terminator]
MAAKRKTKAREAQLAFEALSIEGGLLSPEWLSKVAQLQAGTQAEADYRIHKGLNLRDEIGRYWRIAQAHWADFKSGREAKADPKATAERFVLALLRDAFGFTALAPVGPAVLQERTYPIGYATLAGRVPVVVAPADSGLDTLSSAFGDGARRRSAFGLAQEYLNAQEGALWGIASDGVTLRIVRDNASLTRPAWIEADLQRLFTEDRYADFAALWLLCHETRFGREGQPVTECALEAWRSAGREEGTRAREHLRRGVEEAIVALGQGFLSHAENAALRADLQNGTLPVKDYFNQLLRLVYRLIFLLTVEERGLLHPDGTSDATKALYANGYGIRRLRERSVKRSAHDRFSDLWEATKVVCLGLAAGEPRLGLPALAGIFAANQCPALDGAKLENRAMLLAVFKLAWLREEGSLSRVNWRDMGPEELGSVYESLLELVPQIAKDGRQFAFATGGETKGNARKTTGSYYTPDSLVQVLLASALEPVIADTIAKNPGNAAEALLGLSIVDPACGSGHFLLAAARRLAAHVARLQTNGTPSAAEYRHALRQVVGRCIFGVDLNPMAVELCKVGLWMEAVEPGLPLTFLNSHIQQGNALLGTTPDLMAKGIPDTAWDPIEGDDKKTASALKKRNKKAAEGQRSLDTLWSKPADAEAQTVTRAVTELDAASDANVEALAKKEERWDGILGSPEYRHQKFVADAWCAAFVWPKQPGELTDAAPTNELWRQLRDGQGMAPALTTKTICELADQYRFFHWHLQFPQVFAKGGFNVVLGNPPWERVKLQEQEFFASRSEEIAKAVNAAARKKLIAKLPEENPLLWDEWCAASRRAEGESHSIRQMGRYPLCGKGDVNTYAIFAEHNRSSLGPRGRAGYIVPPGLATDDTTKAYFQDLVAKNALVALYEFENEEFLFPGIDHRVRFIVITVAKERPASSPGADTSFANRSVTALSDQSRHFTLTPSDFETLNPNTRTCPTFRSRRDADINLAMYRRAGVLWREADKENGNPWGLRFMAMLHMANDSGLFKTRQDLEAAKATLVGNRFTRDAETWLPLIEAKMIHIFDHRFGTYEGQTEAQDNQGKLPEFDDAAHADTARVTLPYYWVPESEVAQRLASRWDRGWLLGWRDIVRSTDQRTVIASLLPRVAVGHTTPLMMPSAPPKLCACLYASLCSFVLDYAARQKIGGTHLTYGYLKQLPVLGPSAYSAAAPWDHSTTIKDWVLARVLRLTFTADDMEPFARDVEFMGPPFVWNAQQRFAVRCELDAAFFRLYELKRADIEHVMDSFPVVRKNDEKANDGVYRTKEAILSIYDELVAAERSGTPYRTRLSPPPADESITHGVPGGGKILPFRPAVRPQPAVQPAAIAPAPYRDIPAWSPKLLPAVATRTGLAASAGRWGTTLTGVDLGIAALAAVLRNIGGPASRDEVERAVVLSVLPGLLQSKFDAQTAPKWRRAIGTANMSLSSITALSIPWAEVLRRATVEHLLVMDADGRWRAGADIDDAPSDVLDARALVALSWLQSLSGVVVDTDLVAHLEMLRAA